MKNYYEMLEKLNTLIDNQLTNEEVDYIIRKMTLHNDIEKCIIDKIIAIQDNARHF